MSKLECICPVSMLDPDEKKETTKKKKKTGRSLARHAQYRLFDRHRERRKQREARDSTLFNEAQTSMDVTSPGGLLKIHIVGL